MSWLSEVVRKNKRGTARLVKKIAAPVAIGALAIPGAGAIVSAAVGAAGKLAGKVAAGGGAGAGEVYTRAHEVAERLDSLPGTFAAGMASGSGATAAARELARHPAVPWVLGAAGLWFLLRASERGPSPSRAYSRR